MSDLDLINLDEYEQLLGKQDALNFHRFYQSLKLSRVNVGDFLRTIPKGKLNAKKLQNHLLKYIIREKKYDFSSHWYVVIKSNINEINKRYTGKALLKHDSITNYRVFFNLYCNLVRCRIYDPLDRVPLFYFLMSQFASRFDKDQGFLTPMQVRFFSFGMCLDIYEGFLRQNCPPSMIGDKLTYLYHDLSRPTFYGYKFHELSIKDMHSTQFVSTAMPILEGKLPNIETASQSTITRYLTTLEYLMIREDCLKRTFNRVLLSLEHLRAYRYARSKYPRRFSN